MNLNKPPKQPLISAGEVGRNTKWTLALDKTGLGAANDPFNEYTRLKTLVPTGHVGDVGEDGFFRFSEEFVDAVYNDPQFFQAWIKINDL